MRSLTWYFHRLRAMDGPELAGRIKNKIGSFFGQRTRPNWKAVPLEAQSSFPTLPDRNSVPGELRVALENDAEAILKGQWTIFRGLPAFVDDPPRWQYDYLARQDLQTDRSAFKLDHRALPAGADIKVIWELSRWSQLVRLAQAGWFGHKAAALKCIEWLRDWASQNPRLRGWNWTSALESGIRLIQFTWIDALLQTSEKNDVEGSDLEQLRYEILPAHVWFTWRHKSLGSSANNHLLGEFAGLIIATSRWPALEKWGASLATLQPLWEREVLAQFAKDGGNLEQALNYHLFSFELAWQTQMALRAAGLEPSEAVQYRLARAARFFADVQVESEPWDYGDSDNGYVTPLFANESTGVQEWRRWLEHPAQSPVLHFWLGEGPSSKAEITSATVGQANSWKIYSDTGIAVQRTGDWILRFDLSPVGYLTTAAHGHLDALHLSIWFRGKAMVIDPGTGAYYADGAVRNYLASWQAHNGPRFQRRAGPRRAGPFLWTDHHSAPTWQLVNENQIVAGLRVHYEEVSRRIEKLDSSKGWAVEDTLQSGATPIVVRWQFPPGAIVQRLDERRFRLEREGIAVWIEVSGAEKAELVDPKRAEAGGTLDGICSRIFRKIERGPFLDIQSSGHKPCLLRTAFLLSPPS